MKIFTIPVLGQFYIEAETREEALKEVQYAAQNAGVHLLQVLPDLASDLEVPNEG